MLTKHDCFEHTKALVGACVAPCSYGTFIAVILRYESTAMSLIKIEGISSHQSYLIGLYKVGAVTSLPSPQWRPWTGFCAIGPIACSNTSSNACPNTYPTSSSLVPTCA